MNKTIMRKLSLLLLALLIIANASYAETALIVHQKLGGTVEYAFGEKPVVTYNDGYLIISAQEASVMYPMSNLQKFTFGEVSDNVTRIKAPADVAPQPTYIYNIGGILMHTLQPTKDNSTPATIDGLPAGTYIIKNGSTNYKIAKR